jgi:Lrp/AsnC family transcriptional regulator, leucine-responsive regulatory protein
MSGRHTHPASLDALDRRLLRAVQNKCTLTADELAERCATSPSTALRRLNRMRVIGVIKDEVAVVDGPAVGQPLMMVIHVRTRQGEKTDAAALRGLVLANPAVMQFYFVTGSTDYVIVYSAASMEVYDDFIESVLAVDPNLHTDTNVVIRPLKMSLAIPIP